MKDQQEDQIRRSLQDSEGSLDEFTVKKLAQARQSALARLSQTEQQMPRGYSVPALRLVAASMVLAIGVVFFQQFYSSPNVQTDYPMPLLASVEMDETELVTIVSEGELDLYEDLEFYAWFAESDYSG